MLSPTMRYIHPSLKFQLMYKQRPSHWQMHHFFVLDCANDVSIQTYEKCRAAKLQEAQGHLNDN